MRTLTVALTIFFLSGTVPSFAGQVCDRRNEGSRCIDTLALDCNGNGRVDAEDIETGFSQDCNENGLPDDCELGSIRFASQPAEPVDGAPGAVALGDLDGNGLSDIASANTTEGGISMSLLFNRGNREFERADLEAAVWGKLVALAAGDLDGDGDLDLIGLGSTALGTLLNDGQGNFDAPLETPVTVTVSGLTIGDVNGDGAADVVVSERRLDVVSVRLGDATGASPELLAGALQLDVTDFATGDSPRAPVIGDFNDDGHPDIAAVNRLSDDVSLLYGAGDGTFSPPESVPLGKDASPDRLIAADLNGDGHLDLAVGTPDAIVVLRNEGEGTFAVETRFVLASPTGVVESLTHLDADGDGDLDLAAPRVDPTGYTFIVNSGDGSFAQSVDVERRLAPKRLKAGDLDGDGHVDLVEALETEKGVQVWWNREDTEIVSMTQRVFATTTKPHALAVADMDGDGDLDVPFGSNRTFAILYNDGAANLQELAISQGIEVLSIVAHDLDGDGDVDLAGVRDKAYVVFNDGDRQFRTLALRVGLRPFSVSVGDLNGDGMAELITANLGSSDVAILRNQGAEEFLLETFSFGARPIAIEPGDFDADGDVDLVVALESASEIVLLYNDSSGNFPVEARLDVPQPFDVTAADFDVDGDLDLVTTSTLSGNSGLLSILKNRGDGIFAPLETIDPGVPYYSVTPGDVDGNGLLDIIGADERGAVFLYLNNGRGGFDRPLTFRVADGSRFAFPGDLDGDGDTDLAVLGWTDWTIRVLSNDTGSPGAPYLAEICTEAEFYEVAATGDRGDAAERFTKFLVPLDPTAPDGLPPHFQNVRQFALQHEFMAAQFPERFAGLTEELFERLVGRRTTRQYFAGDLFRLQTDFGPAYGFSVRSDPMETPPTIEEVAAVHDTLAAVFRLRPLGFYPDTQAAREAAAAWVTTPFDVFLEDPTEPPQPLDGGPEGTPTFGLEIPADTEVCGAFLGRQEIGVDITAAEWHGLKTSIRFLAGEVALPTTVDTFDRELFEHVRLGPDRELATADGPGTFRLRRFPQGDVTGYRFDFTQTYRLADEAYELRLFNLTFQGRGDASLSDALVLEEEYLTHSLSLEGFRDQTVGYASCTFELLPQWEVTAELTDGSSLRFLERYEVPPPGGTGPASLISAELNLQGEQREVSDYWELIYAARRHNTFIHYWVVLEPPLVLPGLERPVRVVDVGHPQEEPEVVEASVSYLDENFEEIAHLGVRSFDRVPMRPVVAFRRGDVDADDRRNILDALRILNHLFARGDAPPCLKAADTNDDGRLNLVDAIGVVQVLLGPHLLPEPFVQCGSDPTEDSLPCEAYPLCEG